MDRPEKATLLGQQNRRVPYKSEPCVLLEGGSDSNDSSELTRKSSKDICEGDTNFDNDIKEKNPIIASDGDKGKGNTYDDDE
jgi:hypothetical protein